MLSNRDRIRLYFHPFTFTGSPREDQIHEYHLILQELGGDCGILQLTEEYYCLTNGSFENALQRALGFNGLIITLSTRCPSISITSK